MKKSMVSIFTLAIICFTHTIHCMDGSATISGPAEPTFISPVKLEQLKDSLSYTIASKTIRPPLFESPRQYSKRAKQRYGKLKRSRSHALMPEDDQILETLQEFDPITYRNFGHYAKTDEELVADARNHAAAAIQRARQLGRAEEQLEQKIYELVRRTRQSTKRSLSYAADDSTGFTYGSNYEEDSFWDQAIKLADVIEKAKKNQDRDRYMEAVEQAVKTTTYQEQQPAKKKQRIHEKKWKQLCLVQSKIVGAQTQQQQKAGRSNQPRKKVSKKRTQSYKKTQKESDIRKWFYQG